VISCGLTLRGFDCNSITVQHKAIVDTRLRLRCAIPPPPLRPIDWIACAPKFWEYYLRLPGILNDPLCCMTLLTIESSLLQWRMPMLLNGPDNPRKLSLPLWKYASPSNTCFLAPTPSLRPKQHVNQFSRFCTATLSAPLLYNGPLGFPKNLPFPWGIGHPSNTWYLGPTRVINPNGILIGSAIFVLVQNAMLYKALSMGKKTPKIAPSPWDFVTPPEEDQAMDIGNTRGC